MDINDLRDVWQLLLLSIHIEDSAMLEYNSNTYLKNASCHPYGAETWT